MHTDDVDRACELALKYSELPLTVGHHKIRSTMTGFGKTLRMESMYSSHSARNQYLRSKFAKVQILSYPCKTTFLPTVTVDYGGKS